MAANYVRTGSPMIWAFAWLIPLCLIIVLVTRWRYIYVDVVGYSMYPFLQHGDKILARRGFSVNRLKVGQIIVYDASSLTLDLDSVDKAGLVVKRIAALPETEARFNTSEGERRIQVPLDHFFIQGDAVGSLDSRVWGPVPASNIVALAILRMPRKTNSSAKRRSASDARIIRLDVQNSVDSDGSKGL